MGTFYGSIHLRKADRAGISAALAAVPRTAFFLGVEQDGWTPVYPSERGQDTRISRLLAARVRSAVVHLLVHDSDVFCYAVYRDGALVDEYSSRPDYFGPLDAEAHERLRGRPERLGDLFAPGVSAPDVRELLDQAREGEARPIVWDVAAELGDLDRDVERIKQSPELRQLESQLRAQAGALLPAGLRDAPEPELIAALAQHKDPDARRVLDTYQSKLLALLSRMTSSEAVRHALRSNGSAAEQAAAGFARALGLHDALTSYEDIAAETRKPSAPGQGLTHIAGR